MSMNVCILDVMNAIGWLYVRTPSVAIRAAVPLDSLVMDITSALTRIKRKLWTVRCVVEYHLNVAELTYVRLSTMRGRRPTVHSDGKRRVWRPNLRQISE